MKDINLAFEQMMAFTAKVSVPLDKLLNRATIDHSRILVYRKGDLARALRDLIQAHHILLEYRSYLAPALTPEIAAQMGLDPKTRGTRAGALHQLSKTRLFREALDRLDEAENNIPQAHPGSPEQSHF